MIDTLTRLTSPTLPPGTPQRAVRPTPHGPYPGSEAHTGRQPGGSARDHPTPATEAGAGDTHDSAQPLHPEAAPAADNALKADHQPDSPANHSTAFHTISHSSPTSRAFPRKTPGAFAFGLRLVAWEGTALDVPDTPENAAAFGFTGREGANKSGNPQVRLMALIECGTHALIDAAFDSIAGFSEHKLARRLLASLRPGILLLADHNFAGHELWGLVEATGRHLAWRIKKNLVLPPLRVLPDGSYVSVMPTPAEGRRLGNARFHGRTPTELPQGHLVRIIDYTVTVRPQHGPAQAEQFRLATSLPDHRHSPARQLAQLYHQRWGATRSRTRLSELPDRRLDLLSTA